MQQLGKIIFNVTINAGEIFAKASPRIDQANRTAIAVIKNIVETKITFDPPWNSSKISDEGREFLNM